MDPIHTNTNFMRAQKLTPQAYGILIAKAKRDVLPAECIERLRWIAFADRHGITTACRRFGIARSTLIRWMTRFDPGNLESLTDTSKRPHTLRTPETDPETVRLIADIRRNEPGLGKTRIADMLLNRHGIRISTATVGRTIQRHGLFFGARESHRMKRERFKETSGADADIPRDADDGTASGPIPYAPSAHTF